ncbi:cell wall glucanosyltransferase [Phyllosticta citrichinensis]|uniref:Cell wall glucanosyltransferase n=1 Tax=Phyllosticta citrichinensis TaxID=1130410 RepID=A0ABR1Y2P5_9PEZI
MHPSRLSTTAAAAATALLLPRAALAATSCNPTKSSQFPCTPNPGLCKTSFSTDFTSGQNASWSMTYGSVDYTSAGAEFTIAKQGDAPTMTTDFYIWYGKVEVTMKSAPGQGIISSIVLESADYDEVDWEFFGSVNTEVESNYFGKGNTTTYDREEYHTVSTPQDTSHVYTIDWTPSALTWSIDGTAVRTLARSAALGGANYPQTPMAVKLGIWAGGDSSNGYWTREWAGGNTTYSAAAGMPWTMAVEKVEITNYNPAVAYNWTDTSGDSDSIALLGSCAGSSSSSSSSSIASVSAASSSAFAVVSTPGAGGVAVSTPVAGGGVLVSTPGAGSSSVVVSTPMTTPAASTPTPAGAVYTGAAVSGTLQSGALVAAGALAVAAFL